MYGPHGFVIIWQEDSAAIIAPHIHYGWSSGVITASTALWQQLCKAAFYHFAAASSLSRDKTCPPCREWRQCPFVLLHSGLLCVRWVRLARLPKRFEVNRLLSFLYFVSPLSSCQWPGNWSRCEILKNVSIREMYLEERGRLLKELWARSFADVFLVAMTYKRGDASVPRVIFNWRHFKIKMSHFVKCTVPRLHQEVMWWSKERNVQTEKWVEGYMSKTISSKLQPCDPPYLF